MTTVTNVSDLPSSEAMAEKVTQIQEEVIAPVQAATEAKLSTTGRRLLDDTAKIMQETRKILRTKLRDNQLQELVAHSRFLAQKLRGKQIEEKVEWPETLSQTVEDLTLILRLMVQSNEFRQVLNETLGIVEDWLFDVSEAAKDEAPKVAPEWFTKQASAKEEPETFEKTTKSETESTKPSVKAQQTSEIKQEKSSTESVNVPKDVESVNMPTEAEKKAEEKRSDQPKVESQEKESPIDTGSPLAEVGREKLGEAVSAVREKVVPETGSLDRFTTKVRHISSEKLSEDRINALVARFKNLVTRLQRSEQSRDALKNLIAHSTRAMRDIQNMVVEKLPTKDDSVQYHLNQFISNARSILENFSNHHSLDDLFRNIRELADYVRSDSALSSFYDDLGEFFERSLLDPVYVQNDLFTYDAKKLAERGREMVAGSNNYKDRLNLLIQSVQSFWRDVRSDRLLRRYARDWNDLVSDLFLDSNGDVTLKPELFYDARTMAPVLINFFTTVDIPRIEESNDDYDYVVDNVKLTLDDILGHYRVIGHSEGNFGTSEEIGSHVLSMTFSGLRFTLRDMVFWYRKKSGLIHMSDHGLVNASVTGDGLTIDIEILPEFVSADHIFKVSKVTSVIDDLDVDIVMAEHETLYKVFYPLVKRILKDNLEKTISERLLSTLENLDAQLVALSEATKHRLNREPEWSEWTKIPRESSNLSIQVKEE